MSERITEAELAEVSSLATRAMIGQVPCDAKAGAVLLLVAEVRRLRALIVAGSLADPACYPEQDDWLWCDAGLWPPLAAEARAIREEQGKA